VIELTEEEKKLKAGNIIWREGIPYIIQGDFSRFHVISIPYDADWD
jgi:hypothetical protein